MGVAVATELDSHAVVLFSASVRPNGNLHFRNVPVGRVQLLGRVPAFTSRQTDRQAMKDVCVFLYDF